MKKRPAQWKLLAAALLISATSMAGEQLPEVEADDPVVDTVPDSRLAGEEAYWEAVQLFLAGKNHWDRAATLIREAESAGFPPALHYLGSLYLEGAFGFPENVKKGLALIRKAAELKDGDAMSTLAFIYYYGMGVPEDEDQAAAWAEATLQDSTVFYQGEPANPIAVNERPQPLATGDSVVGADLSDPVENILNTMRTLLGAYHADRERYTLAMDYFRQASDLSHGGRSANRNAAWLAGFGYAMGLGVSQDTKRAGQLLEIARRIDQRDSSTALSRRMRQSGMDLMDVTEFRRSSREDIETRYQDAQMVIASQLSNPEFEGYNPENALSWFEMAADHGSVDARREWMRLRLTPDSPTWDPARARVKLRQWIDEFDSYMARINYAILLCRGLGGEEDRNEAATVLEPFLWKEFTPNQILQGAYPALPVTLDSLLAYERKHADLFSDPRAQFTMGLRYEFGADVDLSYEMAERYFRSSADQGDLRALAELGDFRARGINGPVDVEEAHRMLRQAYDGGAPSAAAYLAGLILDNPQYGTPLDALEMYAAYLEHDPDNAECLFVAGRTISNLLEMNNVWSNPDRQKEMAATMLAYWERAAELDFTHACTALGLLYFEGRFVPKNLQKAVLYWQKGASLGSAGCHAILANFYEAGIGVGRNIDQAVYHFRQVLDLEDAGEDQKRTSLTFLADWYRKGYFTVNDTGRVASWLERLKGMGNVWAHEEYCELLFRQGRNKEAITLLKEMREIEDPPDTQRLRGYANARLGRCYAEGIGVRRNDKKAVAFYTWAIHYKHPDGFFWAARETLRQGQTDKGLAYLAMAADRNSPEANFELGLRYLNGDGLQANPARALEHLRRAADLNHAGAMMELARSRLKEVSGSPDLEEAMEFAQRAANLGLGEAVRILAELESLRDMEKSRGASFSDRLG